MRVNSVPRILSISLTQFRIYSCAERLYLPGYVAKTNFLSYKTLIFKHIECKKVQNSKSELTKFSRLCSFKGTVACDGFYVSYLCNETSHRKNKIFPRNAIPFSFFHILLHFEFKLRFQAQNAMWLQHPTPILALILCGWGGRKGGRTGDRMAKD